MRWYISYPVLAAGLAFGFETFFPNEPDLSRPANAKIRMEISAEPQKAPIVLTASEMASLPVSRLESFSPGAPLLTAEIPAPSSSVLDYLAQAFAPSEAPLKPPVPQPITAAAWKSAIVRETPAQPKAAALEPISRVALARDIQRELQRVGCYLGEIDGIWGGGSKRAVLVFMDRVNASLPAREPDVFMLSLLKAQTSPVCGASCPRGQSLTATGRCVPSTLMAQAEKPRDAAGGRRDALEPRDTLPGDTWEAQVAEVSERKPPPYGRMSIGGPKPDDVTQLSAGWSRVTAEPPRGDVLTRTAALEPSAANDDVPPAQKSAPSVASSSFDVDIDAAPVRRSKSADSRAKARERAPRRTTTYRHVQNLFQHPLGRM
ncbi:hypothetical protein [Hyphomicrobium sp.]|uniref:hypothetical protein n=1 Tax=Hyphomicrobium sp. TaxID=82 RepID=UPI0025B7ACA1|nr:hypothetical protein [Hyphomicrobium sp.]MCC7250284.1 hypothetical protein [Hyphomicrobium sp.]